jgi:hypothetical protein
VFCVTQSITPKRLCRSCGVSSLLQTTKKQKSGWLFARFNVCAKEDARKKERHLNAVTPVHKDWTSQSDHVLVIEDFSGFLALERIRNSNPAATTKKRHGTWEP